MTSPAEPTQVGPTQVDATQIDAAIDAAIDDKPTLAPLARIEHWIRLVLYPMARLMLWLLFYLSLLLGGWVLVGMSFGGWTPVVVTSGSMEPAVSVGDVLLIDTTPGNTVSQRSIIVFDRADGSSVAHRVFSVEGDELVTKGDANASPDTDRVAVSEVSGVARVLVPLIGVPAVWRDQGNTAALLAWIVLTFAGAIHFVITLVPAIRNRKNRAIDEADIGQVGIRRVRVLVAVLIAAQFVLEPTRFEILGSSRGRIPLFVALLAILFSTNLISTRVRNVTWRRRLPVIELTVDTLLVVSLSAVTGSGGLGWVLFALPIIEAAVRFGLIGALNHWMVLTTLTIAGRIWSYELNGTEDLLGELESTLDQMSVLFLVVVPGAYLVEQLVGDVAHQRLALSRVVARSTLLERVAESGRDVSQLDGDHVDAVIEGIKRLGFDVVDLVATSGGEWRKLGGSDKWDLPTPGDEASGLRPQDLMYTSVFVSGDDDDEQAALDALGLGSVVTSAVAVTESGRAVLRAGVRGGRALTSGEVDAFRLLAGQASVALQNHELLTEITSIHGELEHRAHHDALTGLPNRVMMLENLEVATAADARPAVMFLDLDGFKPVNDRLGHDAGDELLIQVGKRLLSAAPRDSVVARVGGDEFTILLRGTLSESRAEQVASAVASAIAEPFAVSDDRVQIGTSIGIAFGDGSLPGTELIRRADVAMYVAKHKGEDTPYEFYQAEFDRAEIRRAVLVSDIGSAIVEGQITLVYQPVVRVSTGREIVGVEALVRWNHPTLGAISPPDTVDAAKAARLGAELHRHISFEATQTVAGWSRLLGTDRFFLSINASPEDLASVHLVPNMAEAVAAAQLEPGRVFVEISEQLVSPDVPGVMDNIHALNRAGIRMLLDDFGEGQTSISYIHELPVAGIKLDRKLVVNALRSRTDRIVIQSIVELCARLGLVAIAEGIENEEHMEIIHGAGCNMAQGFHLGMPQPADAVFDVLHQNMTSSGGVS